MEKPTPPKADGYETLPQTALFQLSRQAYVTRAAADNVNLEKLRKMS